MCYSAFQTVRSIFSVIRQGLFYVPLILLLPKLLGVTGICLSQPAADVLTIGLCLALIGPMKRMASKNMRGGNYEETT